MVNRSISAGCPNSMPQMRESSRSTARRFRSRASRSPRHLHGSRRTTPARAPLAALPATRCEQTPSDHRASVRKAEFGPASKIIARDFEYSRNPCHDAHTVWLPASSRCVAASSREKNPSSGSRSRFQSCPARSSARCPGLHRLFPHHLSTLDFPHRRFPPVNAD